MINSGIYDYIDVMNKAADAAWLRETVISQNIAMGDTPGYKRQDVNFEGVLERELGKMKYVSLDENSVDPEQEYAELASTRIRYNALVDSMTSEFNKIKSVIK